jgi:hypothetical protein
MSVLDHFSIIEAICKHLDFKTLRSILFVSKKCAKFFKCCRWIQNAIEFCKIKDENRFLFKTNNNGKFASVKPQSEIRNKIGLYL